MMLKAKRNLEYCRDKYTITLQGHYVLNGLIMMQIYDRVKQYRDNLKPRGL